MKDRVNFYLYHLAKRLLEFDVVGNLYTRPSRTELLEHIEATTSSHRKKTLGSGPGAEDSRIGHIVKNRFKQSIFRESDYSITPKMLNNFVKEIRVLKQFDSWDSFEATFNNDKGYHLAQRFRNVDPEDYDPDDTNEVLNHVEKKLVSLFDIYNMTALRGGKKHKNIIKETADYIIRTANLNDINRIQAIQDKFRPNRANSLSMTKYWIKHNENICFIHVSKENRYNAKLTLLPINDEAFRLIKRELLHENDISLDMILRADQRAIVDNVFIYEFERLKNEYIDDFLANLEIIISLIADPNNPKLRVCALGRTEYTRGMMKNLGCQMTGFAVPDDVGATSEFYEIAFRDLVDAITRWQNPSIDMGE